jgi:FG-GAP-like repeat/Secretion system C-terminal sorting domain
MKPNKPRQSLKYIIANICIVVLFIAAFSVKLSAQRTFMINSHENPLKNFSIPSNKESHPFFVDIDHDGDLDCFSGEYANGHLSKIYFYRNDGTTKASLFKQVTGATNPLNKVAANMLTIPYFIDIDGDGDYDCFIGEGTTGSVLYYKNTGTVTHPQFEKQSAANNPLSMVKFFASDVANPAFADVDGDGDYDCLVVDENGEESYFKNTGTVKNPVFAYVANSDDPFKSLALTNGMHNASFQDWDHDGLIDLFLNTTYYKNIGTKARPQFSLEDINKPVFQNEPEDQFAYTPLRWVDMNKDGNVEVFRGNSNGSFIYQTLSSKDEAIAQNSKSAVTVFPNPAKEAFILNFPGTINGGTAMRVSDVQGKLLITQSLTSNSLKFGKELKPGTYFAQVLQNNKVIYTKKIIKQ